MSSSSSRCNNTLAVYSNTKVRDYYNIDIVNNKNKNNLRYLQRRGFKTHNIGDKCIQYSTKNNTGGGVVYIIILYERS